MQAIKKMSVLTTLLLFLTIAPLYAAEPFYKGEWGMKPTEIAALYNAAPAKSVNKGNYMQTEYTATIEGYPAKVVYNFDANARLYQVNVYFSPNLTAVNDVKALLAKLANMVQPADTADAFRHEDGEFSYPAEGLWNGFHNWQNATDYISLMATINYAETDRAKTKFELDATDPQNPINGVYTEEELDNMP